MPDRLATLILAAGISALGSLHDSQWSTTATLTERIVDMKTLPFCKTHKFILFWKRGTKSEVTRRC